MTLGAIKEDYIMRVCGDGGVFGDTYTHQIYGKRILINFKKFLFINKL